MVKYYVFVAISFLVAISFHASVYRRFGAMEKDLNEAARIKLTMEWDELRSFNYYLQSVGLHHQGIQDTVDAFEYAHAAESLREGVFEEGVDLQRLKEEAREKEQQAEVNKRKSAMDEMSSFRNDRASVVSMVVGINLAKQAEGENERSESMMNRTVEEEVLGKKKLREAQEALEVAEAAQNLTALNKGICKWASVICNAIRTNDGGGNRSQNQTVPVTASDAVINANRDIQNALLMISKAEEERSEAIELHRNASIHANLSTAILWDVQSFKNKSKIDLKDAEEYRTSAEEEEAEAKRDEEIAQQEEADIALKEIEMTNETEHSVFLFERAIKDRYNEQFALEKMNRDLEFVKKRRTEWEQKMGEATHHVARAGWEALVASISGLCLFVLVATRIVATFRYQRPLRWILREPPFFSQDLWYLICHLCIFVLTMGYVGELLMTFHDQTNIDRAGITIVFALSATVLQVTLLYVLPYVDKLFQESRIDTSAIRFLLEKVIIQKGTIIALVSTIEMLLCWCWMGSMAFPQAHKWNNYVVWLVVLCVSVGYGIFLRMRECSIVDYLPTKYGTRSGVLTNAATNKVGMNDETKSLLTPSFLGSSLGFVQGSFQNPSVVQNNSSPVIRSPNASSDSSLSMQSIQLGDSECYNDDYESLSKLFRAHFSTSPMNFSWKSELVKIRLLLEFWMASIALWIIRRDLELIQKLSPLATGLVWGQAPLWILNTSLFLVFVTLIVSFANVKFGR